LAIIICHMANPEATFKLLGLPPDQHTARDFIPWLRAGFPVKTIASVAKSLDLPAPMTWQSLGLAPRTFARRMRGGSRAKGGPRLTAEESERILRLAQALVTATEVLGTIEKARRWLLKDNFVLGATPLSLLDTQVGAQLVLDELGRIDHGVFV
jgi:putative toxin-antitoxin system antitoxin component (TIGR02293 family)